MDVLGAERRGGNHGASIAFGPDAPCGSDPLHSSPKHTHTYKHTRTHTFGRREPKLALDLALWVAEARRQEP